MWSHDNDSAGDGGFDNTTNMFASPSQPESKPAAKPRCIAPVTIRQVLESTEDGLKVKGIDVQVVQIVGIVKSVDVSTIKITYGVEDNTGKILGVAYIEGDSQETAVPVVENTYCTMVGSIRSQGGEKHIMVFNIFPVTDLKMIAEHMLSVIHMGLKAEQMDSVVPEKPIKQEMLSSYGGGTGSSHTSDSLHGYNMDPKFKRVLETIMKSTNESGINFRAIAEAMPFRLPDNDIRAALEYLVTEGHIFTTIDENHYKSVDSSF